MTGTKPQFDPTRKFVRVSEIRPDGFVAFDFAVGEPELYVEMILTQPAFEEFCRVNDVIRLDPQQPDAENDGLAWRLDQATYHKPR
ncbi:MAG TPA: phenol hydroxylase subunit [Rhodocyclaceae bacterium]|jgi:phenol hydroxylase P0 protein|nr:phenol hydroxylase subunit [Rhodocyclaceae bacterium]HMV54460.1 phenol hydroxylase subunit [Rhodocyclaceae bacterium]HNA05081.1 phenol hydroxylase subunit [Rhodocyclaceae bacterium]HNB80268.1 phenol hydroxylase subunit [Rhodocyclaceae bacterium]HNC62845.1 phenol hydroxylase subunit [Rhodocyclaceae bacterium]